jgi:hypothetical protein
MSKALILLILLYSTCAFAKDDHMMNCPHHSEHQKQVAERGDRVMGFDHTKTTHHFLLKDDGGVIVAEANDPADRDSIEQIRTHFSEIAERFSHGDFSMPHEIHARVPPGVPEMTELKDRITYVFHETEKGGEVRITTQDDRALKAIHEFLRFQIEDHHTGDPVQ